MASKAKMTDILILGIISGIVALLTSVMGISGTIIGSVVSSILAELLKTYFKDPVKNKVSEYEKSNIENYHSYKNNYNENYTRENRREYTIRDNYSYNNNQINSNQNTSHITTRALFLFPLVVILIIELVHFLGAINIIPYDIFLNLESLTNWTLFRTIGYALIVMGIYPLVSKKLGTQHGIILIIVGIIELIIGYADTNMQASALFALFSSLKEYVNIAIILAILYTVLTVPEEIKESNKKEYTTKKHYDNRIERRSINRPYEKYDDTYYEHPRNQQNHKSRNYHNNSRRNNYERYEDEIEEDDYYYY